MLANIFWSISKDITLEEEYTLKLISLLKGKKIKREKFGEHNIRSFVLIVTFLLHPMILF